MKVYTIEFDGEEKKIELKEKIKSKVEQGKAWVSRNKEVLIAIAPVTIAGIATATKVVGRHINLRKAESIKNLYCYDRSLGHYWKLRRELSNQEWLEVERRKRNGEAMANILSDLKVLK